MKNVFIAVIVLLGSRVMCGQVDTDTAVIVELKAASIVVKGTRVCLKDIADITTFVSAGRNERATSLRAEMARLVRFTRKKDKFTLTHDDVRVALFKSGFSKSNVEIKGPTRIRVRRKTIRLSNRRILDMAKRFVRNGLVGIDESAVITFERRIPTVEVPEARWSSELSIVGDPKNLDFIGTVRLQLTAELDGVAEVLATIPVLVTRKVLAIRMDKAVKRGTILKRSDIVLEKRAVSRLGTQLFFRVSDVVGMVAKRDLEKGEDILRSDVKQTPVVRPDDLITVKVSAGALTVETICLVLQEGSPGERILVQNMESKGQFTVVVVDSRNAIVKRK